MSQFEKIRDLIQGEPGWLNNERNQNALWKLLENVENPPPGKEDIFSLSSKGLAPYLEVLNLVLCFDFGGNTVELREPGKVACRMTKLWSLIPIVEHTSHQALLKQTVTSSLISLLSEDSVHLRNTYQSRA